MMIWVGHREHMKRYEMHRKKKEYLGDQRIIYLRSTGYKQCGVDLTSSG
jgi:hypothetical protein